MWTYLFGATIQPHAVVALQPVTCGLDSWPWDTSVSQTHARRRAHASTHSAPAHHPLEPRPLKALPPHPPHNGRWEDAESTKAVTPPNAFLSVYKLDPTHSVTFLAGRCAGPGAWGHPAELLASREDAGTSQGPGVRSCQAWTPPLT